MSGNLCRCGAYPNIVAAIQEVDGREARMHPFDYSQAPTQSAAVQSVAPRPDAKFLAGGTTLIDLIKLHVERPAHLVDVTGLPLAQITDLPGGGVRIGALVKNSDLAHDAAHSAELTRCCPRRCCPARRRSSATWRPRRGT